MQTHSILCAIHTTEVETRRAQKVTPFKSSQREEGRLSLSFRVREAQFKCQKYTHQKAMAWHAMQMNESTELNKRGEGDL